MAMRSDFGVLIPTHGRPNRVLTIHSLRRCGYTGRITLVLDNEDKTVDEYHRRFDDVVVFDKRAMADVIDAGDNFDNLRGVVFARNASFDIARSIGVRFFMVLDDDYSKFNHKRKPDNTYWDCGIKDLDGVFTAMLEYFESVPRLLSLAMAQGGDFMGGERGSNWRKPRRKCMNSFLCSVDRPFQFYGRINEDTTTYVILGSRGGLFLTTMQVGLQQMLTQQNPGGMTGLYLEHGTYVKSFYTVMYHPSSVKIDLYPTENSRLHHSVIWRNTVPVILDGRWQKARRQVA